MIFRTSLEKIQEYYNSDAINQSRLKILEDGIDAYLDFLNKPKSRKSYFDIGSAVDCLLTGNTDDFDKLYFVSSNREPASPSEKAIIEKVFSIVAEIAPNPKGLESYTSILATVIDESNYQPNWKPETRINKLVLNGSEYWDELIEAKDKTILTPQAYETILSCVERVKTSPIYADSLKPIEARDEDIYYQLPIYFTLYNISCKALVDCVRVIHEGDVIHIIPFDLKTTSKPIINFPVSYQEYGYDFQEAFYLIALHKFFEKMYPTKTIKIDSFSFIVVCTKGEGRAVRCEVFVSPDALISLDERITEIMRSYSWHFLEKKSLIEDRVVVESNHHLKLFIEDIPNDTDVRQSTFSNEEE